MTPSVGSMTSPAPLTIRLVLLSTTASIASSRRSTRSVRHSLASSMTARRVFSGYSLSFFSNRSSSAKASAALPAKPVNTLPPPIRRIFTASALATTLPSVTCPSPPSATSPSSRRTLRIVVDLAGRCFMRYDLSRNRAFLLPHPAIGRDRPADRRVGRLARAQTRDAARHGVADPRRVAAAGLGGRWTVGEFAAHGQSHRDDRSQREHAHRRLPRRPDT